MKRECPVLRSALLLPTILWLLFSTTSILLASRQYTAVDGALRCLAVYWQRPPYIGSNNHLLYPTSVWLWWHLARTVGVSVRSPIAFLHLAAALNAICAGGSIALVYTLVWRLTQNWKSSLLAALIYAFSWAMLLHATSSAEPVAGLFVSLIAALFIVVGLSRGRLTPLFAGGLCLALALANYESMFLVAPMLYLLCVVWPTGTGISYCKDRFRLPLLRTLVSIVSTVIGVAAIYGTVYYSISVSSPREMIHSLFRLGGEPEVYGGFRIAKLANLPLGLAGNLVGIFPAQYQGMRWLLQTDKMAFAAAVGIFAVSASVSLLLLRFTRALCRSPQAIALAFTCGAGLLAELLPLLYWEPMYSKLWLQPFAVLTVLGGVLASWMDRTASRRCAGVVLLLTAIEIAVNVPQVVLAHTEPTHCLDDALLANKFIRPRDRVVTDFDAVSSLWMGLYDQAPARTLLFPATTPSVSLTTLHRWTLECASSGCRVLFIALLDQPRNVWEAFLGSHLKVQYDSLSDYRRLSHSISEFSCENGSLRVYEPAAINQELRARMH
jgi:hypothetical protein